MNTQETDRERRLDARHCFYAACAAGHLSAAKRLHNTNAYTRQEYAAHSNFIFCTASGNGHVEIVNWLSQEFIHPPRHIGLACLQAAYERQDSFMATALQNVYEIPLKEVLTQAVLDNIARQTSPAFLHYIASRSKTEGPLPRLALLECVYLAARYKNHGTVTWAKSMLEAEKSKPVLGESELLKDLDHYIARQFATSSLRRDATPFTPCFERSNSTPYIEPAKSVRILKRCITL